MSDRSLHTSFLQALKQLRRAFWMRRLMRGLVRALWVGLLPPAVYLAGHLWRGWTFGRQVWAYPAVASAGAALLWSLRPIRMQKMVRGLDRRMALRARIVTAYEVAQAAGERNPVVQRLFEDSTRLAHVLRRHVRTFNPGFWLELQTLTGVVVLVLGLVVLDGLDTPMPNAAALDMPAAWQEPTADQIRPPDPQLFPPPGAPEGAIASVDPRQMQDALQALADALRDNAVTRGIAEALDQGDLAEAAAGLRRLADQLGELSLEARRGLGEALEEAADQTQGSGLEEPLRDASEALREEDVRAAEQALEALAESLERMGEAAPEAAQEPGGTEPEPGEEGSAGATDEESSAAQGAGAGEGAGPGDGSSEYTPSEAERLAVEGQPLELESETQGEESVFQPAEPGAEPGSSQPAPSPFARGVAGSTAGDLGPDSLAYPWSRRDVIRRYFTP